MFNKISIVFVLVTGVLFCSCKKDDAETPPANLSSPNTPALSDFYKNNASSPMVMTLSASVAYSITGTKGTELSIPANAFMTGFGAIVTGSVEFSMIECYTKKELILNKVQTTTMNDLLVSGGALKFNASQNGQTLKLYPGKKIAVRIPAGTIPSYSMQLFNAVTDFNSNDLVWQLAVSPTVAVAQDTVNVINPYYYTFTSDSLNWINCDYFYSAAGPKTNVNITVHGNYNASNTSIYLVFNGIRSVARLYGSGQSFTQNYQIPVGMGMTIVSIARINGNFYASYTNATVAANHVQDVNLTATTEADILAKLATF